MHKEIVSVFPVEVTVFIAYPQEVCKNRSVFVWHLENIKAFMDYKFQVTQVNKEISIKNTGCHKQYT